jgi:hypothetical protein
MCDAWWPVVVVVVVAMPLVILLRGEAVVWPRMADCW